MDKFEKDMLMCAQDAKGFFEISQTLYGREVVNRVFRGNYPQFMIDDLIVAYGENKEKVNDEG